jgi:hypothetical protein
VLQVNNIETEQTLCHSFGATTSFVNPSLPNILWVPAWIQLTKVEPESLPDGTSVTMKRNSVAPRNQKPIYNSCLNEKLTSVNKQACQVSFAFSINCVITLPMQLTVLFNPSGQQYVHNLQFINT